MRLSALPYFQILLIAAASTPLIAFPFRPFTPNNVDQHQHQQQQQQPLMAPSSNPTPSTSTSTQQPQIQQENVRLSDVMGRDRSMNVFAGQARDVEEIGRRLEDATRNSTVLAPRNSAIDRLRYKLWEDPEEYKAQGENAYGGEDGRDRMRRNLRRFVEAYVVPVSPWGEGERRKTLLEGDGEIWWETRAKDGVRVIQPDNIEVVSVSSRVGNGEVWILGNVRNMHKEDD